MKGQGAKGAGGAVLSSWGRQHRAHSAHPPFPGDRYMLHLTLCRTLMRKEKVRAIITFFYKGVSSPGESQTGMTEDLAVQPQSFPTRVPGFGTPEMEC